MSIEYLREDPTFELKTPLLFAHRGGAREVPESSAKGFTHALENANADVLELDVQLTKDGEFVVWHGPKLNNVRIRGQCDRPIERPRNRKKIYHYEWGELNGKAWVADPEVNELNEEDIDLSNVEISEDRLLLLLSDFLEKFPNIPLNIEMKKSFKRKINDTDRLGLRHNIKAFIEILTNDPGDRKIVVVSAYDDYIDEFRKLNEDQFPTGLSAQEQLIFQFINRDMKNRALETSHNKLLSSKSIIERVQKLGGSTFVFLTGLGPLLPSIDDDPKEDEIFEILNRGIDGIMTDRPRHLRGIMDKWIKTKRGEMS